MVKMYSIAKLIVAFIGINLLLACTAQENAKPNDIIQTEADIALYSDDGCWEESVTAAKHMFQWMGYSVEIISAQYIKQNGLDGFKGLCIPGGNMYQYSNSLSLTGINEIKDFISNGGAYIGICGGAYFAGEKVIWRGNQLIMNSLELFNGSTEGPINDLVQEADSVMCKVVIDSSFLIAEIEADTAWILYFNGPTLMVEDTNVSVVAKYDINGLPCSLAFHYSDGKVFLIGTHPEIEEDSDRDGLNWAGDDIFEDRGSDWDFMKKAVDWCIKKDFDTNIKYKEK